MTGNNCIATKIHFKTFSYIPRIDFEPFVNVLKTVVFQREYNIIQIFFLNKIMVKQNVCLITLHND